MLDLIKRTLSAVDPNFIDDSEKFNERNHNIEINLNYVYEDLLKELMKYNIELKQTLPESVGIDIPITNNYFMEMNKSCQTLPEQKPDYNTTFDRSHSTGALLCNVMRHLLLDEDFDKQKLTVQDENTVMKHFETEDGKYFIGVGKKAVDLNSKFTPVYGMCFKSHDTDPGNYFNTQYESFYLGKFDEDMKPHGKNGLMYYDLDFTELEPEFVLDDKKKIWNFGKSWYRGELKNGVYDGPAKMLATGKELELIDIPLLLPGEQLFNQVYINGKFEEGKMEGQNTVQFIDCLDLDRGIINSATGVFKEGYLQGQGTIKYANGDTFVGNFVDGLRQGLGKYTENAIISFSGDFMKDKIPEKGNFEIKLNELISFLKDVTLIDGIYKVGSMTIDFSKVKNSYHTPQYIPPGEKENLVIIQDELNPLVSIPDMIETKVQQTSDVNQNIGALFGKCNTGISTFGGNVFSNQQNTFSATNVALPIRSNIFGIRDTGNGVFGTNNLLSNQQNTSPSTNDALPIGSNLFGGTSTTQQSPVASTVNVNTDNGLGQPSSTQQNPVTSTVNVNTNGLFGGTPSYHTKTSQNYSKL